MPFCWVHKVKVGEMDTCEKCNPTGERLGKCEDCSLVWLASELRKRRWDGALVGPCCSDDKEES